MKGVPFKGPFSLPPAMGKSHFGFSRARIKVTVQARAASGLLSLCSQLQSMVCRVAVWLLGHMVGEHRSWNKQVQRNRTGARGIREKEFFVSDIYQDFLCLQWLHPLANGLCSPDYKLLPSITLTDKLFPTITLTSVMYPSSPLLVPSPNNL